MIKKKTSAKISDIFSELLMCLSQALEETCEGMWEWNTAGAFLTAGYSAWSDSQYLMLTTAYSDFSHNKPLLIFTWPLPSWEWSFVRVQYLCDE